MVSFQCHACGDVVKKPKLDQHRSRCLTGFDCIDCSKTFKTPADYKGHTSCISEAEKYQKGLYKGPKTKSTDQLNDLPNKTTNGSGIPVSRQSNAQWNRNTQTTSVDNVNGYPGAEYQHQQNGYRDNHQHHRGRGGNNSRWQQNRFPRSGASGANDTPLGMPRRSSSDDQSSVNGVVRNGGGLPENGADRANPQTNGKPPKEKRKKDDFLGKEKPSEPDPAKAEASSAVVPRDIDGERKSKKRKRKEENGEACPETEADTGSEVKEKGKKEKRRREKEADDERDSADVVGSEDKKKKRKELNDEPEVKKKKEKKRKEKSADDDLAEDVALEETTKTKKKAIVVEVAEMENDLKKKKKTEEKKRKRHEETNESSKKKKRKEL